MFYTYVSATKRVQFPDGKKRWFALRKFNHKI